MQPSFPNSFESIFHFKNSRHAPISCALYFYDFFPRPKLLLFGPLRTLYALYSVLVFLWPISHPLICTQQAYVRYLVDVLCRPKSRLLLHLKNSYSLYFFDFICWPESCPLVCAQLPCFYCYSIAFLQRESRPLGREERLCAL